jgi:hypothetical protein
MGRTRSHERSRFVGIVVALAAGVVPYARAQDGANDKPNKPSVAQTCVSTYDIDHTKVIDSRNILFYLHNDTVLQNVLPKQCYSLGVEKRFGYEAVSHKLCAGGSISVVARHSTFSGPGMGFGLPSPDYGAGPTGPRSPIQVGSVNPATTSPATGLAPTFNCRIGMFLPINDDEVDRLLAAAAEKGKSKRKDGGIKAAPAKAPPAKALPAETAASATALEPPPAEGSTSTH